MISRRKFIKFGALATIGGFTLGSSGNAFGQIPFTSGSNLLSAESLSNPLTTYKCEHFVPFVNTHFKIQHKSLKRRIDLRLIEAKDLKSKANASRGITGDCYSLFFETENAEQIDGKIYNVSHNSLGEFSLFIEPVTASPNRFEAVIFRLNS